MQKFLFKLQMLWVLYFKEFFSDIVEPVEKLINSTKTYIVQHPKESLFVFVITLFALILRITSIAYYGDLWLDELYSWYFASMNNVFTTVTELIKQDIHMPFYFIILHFWIKIFGSSDMSLHFCSLVISLPAVPIIFYVAKNLFNKFSGYSAAIFLAISTFCVYYSVEARFYGLIIPLALLAAYFFVRMLETFEKKYFILFIVFNSLLTYTFASAVLLAFIYILVALAYTFYNAKSQLKIVIKNMAVLFAIILPAIIINIFNLIALKSQICSFTRDIYPFSYSVLYNVLENYFSNNNISLFGNTDINFSFTYFVFVCIPIILALIAFIKVFTRTNTKLTLFLLPSLLFMFLYLFLAVFGLVTLLVKYTILVYPIIICSVCYGFSMFDKKCGLVMFSVLILLNYSYLFIADKTVLAVRNNELGNLPHILNDLIKVKDNDLILIPYSQKRVKRYISKGKCIPFNADDMLLLKDDYSWDKYLGLNSIDKKTIREFLHGNIIYDNPPINFRIVLENQNIYNMKKGDKFIIISYRDSFTMPLIKNWDILKDDNVYNNINMFTLMMSKVLKDCFAIASENLNPEKYYVDEDANYSVYVYVNDKS